MSLAEFKIGIMLVVRCLALTGSVILFIYFEFVYIDKVGMGDWTHLVHGER